MQVSQVYTNIDATVESEDPSPEDPACHTLSDPIQAPVWFEFEGDGQSYYIQTYECAGASDAYLEDTQMLIGTGGCGGDFNEVACVEDIDSDAGEFEAGTQFDTEDGVTYYIMVDGYLGAVNEFCVAFTNMTSGLNELEKAGVSFYPNPANSVLNLNTERKLQRMEIIDASGRTIKSEQNISSGQRQFDVSGLQSGMYLINIHTQNDSYTGRFIRQ